MPVAGFEPTTSGLQGMGSTALLQSLPPDTRHDSWPVTSDRININLSKTAVVVMWLVGLSQDQEAMGLILAIMSYVVVQQL